MPTGWKMNLREFKAKLNKLVKEAYSLLEASGHFIEGSYGIQIDEKDPYKEYERKQAWEIQDKLYDFIALSEYLLEKPKAKGVIKRNKDGQFMLNSHVIDEETTLEVKLWNERYKKWEWWNAWLEDDQKGYYLKAVTERTEQVKSEEKARKLTGLEARIKGYPPIWSKGEV